MASQLHTGNQKGMKLREIVVTHIQVIICGFSREEASAIVNTVQSSLLGML